MRPDRIVWNASEAIQKAGTSNSFCVGVRAEAESVDLLIHGIVGDDWTAMDSASVTTFLRANRGKQVNVDINSPGGLAFDGISIYNELVQHDARVNVNITGMAGSAASIIAMAGDVIRIAGNAQFFVHRALMIAIGNQADMLDAAEFLERLDDSIAATYAARTGRTKAKMMEYMIGASDGTTFVGQQAIDEKFADELIELKSRKNLRTDNGDDADNRLREQFKAEMQAREKAVFARVVKLRVDDIRFAG